MNTQFLDKTTGARHQVPTFNENQFSDVGHNAVLILAENGMIVEANHKAEALLNISAGQLRKLHISSIISTLKKIDLLDSDEKRVNAYLRFLSRIGHKFKLRSLSGTEFSGELFFSDIQSSNQYKIAVKIQPL